MGGGSASLGCSRPDPPEQARRTPQVGARTQPVAPSVGGHAAPLLSGDLSWLQRTAGNAAAQLLIAGGATLFRAPPNLAGPSTSGDANGDVFPPPRTATWSTDRFEATFIRAGSTLTPKFEIRIRYIGDHRVALGGDGVAIATVDIAPDKPLNVRVVSVDSTGLTVDLYGDGKSVVEVRDKARMSELGEPGRSHTFNAWIDQRNASSSSVTILDPKASPADLTVVTDRENPGENPVFSGKGFGADGWSALIDGDGDQDKELELTLKLPDADGNLDVTAQQRSSKVVRAAALPVADSGSWLMPHVKEVTDGRSPTELRLFSTPEPTLKMDPGVHSPAASTYRLTLGSATANLDFPAETAERRKIAAAGPAQIAGGVLATDITLGAYRDPFRLSFRQMDSGVTTFGLSALNDGVPRDTVGASLTVSGPIRYRPIDVGSTGLGIDLNGDGKSDLEIYDQLTTPDDVNGGGPPARSRDHRIRVLGPAIGTERTYQFQYRYGGMLGVNGTRGEVNIEAGRNAEAVTSLAEQAKATTLDDTMDQIEISLLAMRRRAVDRKLFTQDAYDKNLALWQVLVRLRSTIPTGVPNTLQTEALKAAENFQQAYVKDLGQPTWTQTVPPAALAGALRAGTWSGALSAYTSTMTVLDRVLRDRMEKAGGESDKDLKEASQLGELRSELREIPGGRAIRVAGTYHPDEKFRTEQGYVSMVPLQLYAWKQDDEWKLKDVTNPSKPFTYSCDAEPGQSLPPLKLFAELDDPDHLPSGAINIQVPGGVAGRVAVQDSMTWKKFFTYLGLTLGAIGLTLAAVASAGAASAAVPAAWALGASAIAGATAAGIDLAEHIQHDNLDARTAVLDIAQIAANVLTAGGLAAGRIVVAAGAAPAAARWTGAWAQAAMLAQRAYIPMTVGAAAADVVTVAVMTEGTLRQLDAIDRSGADPDERLRAKTLLLIQAGTMAGLTALQLKGLGPLGRGETLVLSQGPDGLPMVSAAVRAETVIIDSNVAIALRKRDRISTLKPGETLGPGEALQPGEIALLKKYDAMNPADVRIADTTAVEAAAKTGSTPERGFAIGVNRSGTEYQDVLAVLEKEGVGKGKGAADRQIVADAFFAVGEPGVVPTLATMDPGIYKKLYAIKVANEGGTPLVKFGGKALPDVFPDGFTVTIGGRPLKVMPMPNK